MVSAIAKHKYKAHAPVDSYQPSYLSFSWKPYFNAFISNIGIAHSGVMSPANSEYERYISHSISKLSHTVKINWLSQMHLYLTNILFG